MMKSGINKERIKAVLTILIFLAVFGFSLYQLTSLLERKDSRKFFASFYTEKTGFDVLFIGSSHVRYAFFPMELWEDYGISSYNFSSDGNTLAVDYWMLVNALDYQKPELVVLDVYDHIPGRIIPFDWQQVHMATDAIPFSLNKYRMVMDLFRDRELKDGDGKPIYEKKWELLFKLIAYHSRWSELAPSDYSSRKKINEDSRVLKGASIVPFVEKRAEMTYDGTYQGEPDEMSRDYLERIIRLCKEQDIELLLINTGFDCREDAKIFSDSVPETAASYGVPYIDFTLTDVVDFRTDLSTPGPNTHMNASGAQHLTAYIGRYFQDHCHLPDHRGDVEYAAWEKDLEAYYTYKTRLVNDQKKLDNCLVLLNDDDYYTLFEIRDEKILADETTAALFENIGVDPGMISGGNNIVVLNNAEKTAGYYSFDYSERSVWETPAGSVEFDFEEDGSGRLKIDGKQVYEEKDPENDFRIRAVVLRTPDCKRVAVKEF